MFDRVLRPGWVAGHAIFLTALFGGGVQCAHAASCPHQVAVAVDASAADTLAVTYFCRGLGQTFVASDTIIHSISVWVPPTSAEDYYLATLFITEAIDGTPIVDRLIYAGPLVERPLGDPVLPTEFRFEFNPPISLPHRGEFFFDVQADYYSAFQILASNADPYPEGKAWQTGPIIDCSAPGNPRSYLPHPDLVFEIVFCTDSITTTDRRTWGSLKVRYR